LGSKSRAIVTRFPRWEAKRWGIGIRPASGQPFNVPVTSYWPYSGQTPADGVTGELVDGGTHPAYQLSGVEGKIVFVDIANAPARGARCINRGVFCRPALPCLRTHSMLRSPVNKLAPFQKAGAAAVILGWTNVSDANAADQYSSLWSALAEYPRAVCGPRERRQIESDGGQRRQGDRGSGGGYFPRCADRDSLIATLPGSSSPMK
jgi:hypothetical protein